MTDEEIKNAWSYMEGKADGLVEAGKTVNLPVMFARHIIECTSKQRPWIGLIVKDVSTIEANAISKEFAVLMAETTLRRKNT